MTFKNYQACHEESLTILSHLLELLSFVHKDFVGEQRLKANMVNHHSKEKVFLSLFLSKPSPSLSTSQPFLS